MTVMLELTGMNLESFSFLMYLLIYTSLFLSHSDEHRGISGRRNLRDLHDIIYFQHQMISYSYHIS